MAETAKSVFETLNEINVNEQTEKKNGLTYLSWAWAWADLKKVYPDATYRVVKRENGLNYWDDGRTAWVECGVTVNGQEMLETLPIMDYRNRSIPLENITSMDVNKSIKRCITKAIALHGLGLYIYAGEDLPSNEAEIVKEQAKKKNNKKEEYVPPTPELTAIHNEIIGLCNQLGGTKNTELMSTLKEYASNGNPKAIKDLEKAKECCERIKKIKPID